MLAVMKHIVSVVALLSLLVASAAEAGGHLAVAPSIWCSTQDGGDSDVGGLLKWRQDIGEEGGHWLELRGGFYPGFFADEVDVTVAEIAWIRTVAAQENKMCYFGAGTGYYSFDSSDAFSWSNPMGAFLLAGMETSTGVEGGCFTFVELSYAVLRADAATSTEALGISTVPSVELSDTISLDGLRATFGVGFRF